MVVLAALGASVAYALASVLQQHAASRAPKSHALRMRLLVNLLGRPLWLVGILSDLAGYALQFIALGHGSLVLVQPLLVTGLLFALPLGALFAGRGMPGWREWAGAAAVCGGLALFLVVANPDAGSSTTSSMGWAIVSVGTIVPSVILVWLSRGRSGPARASLQAVAAGTVYGLAAALTKTVAHVVTDSSGGFWHTVAQLAVTWQTWGVIITGLVTLMLAQSAFQAGPLGWSLPALTVVDPVVSIIIGAVAFAEPISDSPAGILLEGLGLVLLTVGVVALTRSPVVVPASPPPADQEVRVA
ncbi:MAG TPA: DMT family transporter [Acidimicrobiales bacterium]|nr:DMT family transporter [Acidimicrobiales bacterium]